MVAVKVTAAPKVAGFWGDDTVMLVGSAAIVTANVLDAVCGVAAESFTVMVMPLVVPAVVGVPEITPAELRVRPGGSEFPVDQRNGAVPRLFDTNVTL
jgi:hypothetical protein